MSKEILQYLEDKFSENEYRLAVGKSPLERVIFLNGNKPLAQYDPKGKQTWFIFDSEEVTNSVIHEPTKGFWEQLLITEDESSKIAEYISHSKAYGLRDSLPELDHWKTVYSRGIPEYEARICHSLSRALLELRMNTKTVYSDHPQLRRLLQRAYIELDIEDIPEYLYRQDVEWDEL